MKREAFSDSYTEATASAISIALNLNNDWSHVSIADAQAKALKNRFDFCMQIVLSQQKYPLPSLTIN